MKKTLILIFTFLAGCTDFISTFYEIDPKATIQIDQNLSQQSDIGQTIVNKDMNTNHSAGSTIDMMSGKMPDSTIGGIPGGTIAGSIPGGTVAGSIPGGTIGGSIPGGTVGGMIDETMIRSCLSYVIIKVNDQQIEFEGCTNWESNFEISKDTNGQPSINRGAFTLKNPTQECLLTIKFESLSCGTELVYEVEALLNLTHCSLVPNMYHHTFEISRDQGLIIDFNEIQVQSIDSSVSDSLFSTKLSGHIGTAYALSLVNETNNITINDAFIYASNFMIQSTDTWQTTNIMSLCYQKDYLSYDDDGDGEASEIYVPNNSDCNDRDQSLNSRNPERCAPCRSNCPKMISIGAGTFQMGTDPSETGSVSNEQPEHLVSINNFDVSEHEITVGEYRTCVQSGDCVQPINITGQSCNWTPRRSQKENHPMNCINWQEARIYANWVGGDLLSESQWEYIATAQGEEQIYPWGNDFPNCDLANHMLLNAGNYRFCINPPIGATSPVCSLRSANTVQGICDLAGNVSEWVLDEWHHYDLISNSNNGQAWCSDMGTCNHLPEILRVHRGGGWHSGYLDLRSSARLSIRSDTRDQNIGFRIAKPLR